jgi:hypothetical protein
VVWNKWLEIVCNLPILALILNCRVYIEFMKNGHSFLVRIICNYSSFVLNEKTPGFWRIHQNSAIQPKNEINHILILDGSHPKRKKLMMNYKIYRKSKRCEWKWNQQKEHESEHRSKRTSLRNYENNLQRSAWDYNSNIHFFHFFSFCFNLINIILRCWLYDN